MSTRVRNPEIYVKGYGKNTTKDDLKSWFKEFGKIICIQYKGPYSFIVSYVSLRSLRTIMMLNLLWRRWMTRKWKDSAWLWNLQERSAMDQVIGPEVAVATTRRNTAEDAGTTRAIQFFFLQLLLVFLKELRLIFLRLWLVLFSEPQGEWQIKA